VSERKRNRSVVFTSATAEATEDGDGDMTVTVHGTFTHGGYTQTTSIHLDLDAAYALLRELDNVL
jgi:hypothetical protein